MKRARLVSAIFAAVALFVNVSSSGGEVVNYSVKYQFPAGTSGLSDPSPDTSLLNRKKSSTVPANKLHKKKALWFAVGNVVFGTAGYFWSQKAWGTSSGKFHWKHDWTGDNMAQNDEVSHLVVSYKVSQSLKPVYQWLGFSPARSMTFGSLHSALLGTLIEYPIDAYNPLQGLGTSDLVANYIGCGLALGHYHVPALRNFDLKLSFKQAPWIANPHGVAGTPEEFDNEIFWLVFRPVYKKINFLHLGVGYSTNHYNYVVEREYYLGVGTTIPDVVSLVSRKIAGWLSPLNMFYIELHKRLD